MSNPIISVIIPAYKDWAALRSCLDALSVQSVPQENFEVLVANNDPQEKCPYAADIGGNVIILPAPRPGSYAARNAAVARASGEIFAFTDSDCIPDPIWLEAGVECLQQAGPDVWVTGPIDMYRPAGGDRLIHLHDERFAFGAYAGIEKRAGATGNMFVTRSTFNRVGAFDDSLFSGGDSEWKRRARRHGVHIMIAERARVSHPSRRNFTELARKERRRAGGSVRLGSVSLGSAVARLRPPLGQINAVSWEGVSFRDKVAVFAIAWRLRALWLREYFRVRFGRQDAERR